jgi:hypothetical protein
MFKKILLALGLLGAASVNAQSSVIRQDNVKVGRGTATDKSITFDKGSGASNPAIKWNNTSSALQFTNDGTNYLDFGSGSGGSGGYSVLVNGDFETGVDTGWTYSGSTVTAATSGSNLLIGGKSAVFDATANNEYIQSSDYTLPNGLYGRNCYAQILYKGGDANLSLQVLDGSDNVLGSTALVAATNPVRAYFNFICPTSGSIQLKVKASADAAAIALDSMFLGEAINIANISQAQAIVTARRASSTQTIASTAATDIVFNAEDLDVYSEFDVGTGIFTSKGTKRLIVSASVNNGNITANEQVSLTIVKNGSSYCQARIPSPASVIDHMRSVGPCIVDVVAGDLVKVQSTSTADSSYDINAGEFSKFTIMQFPTTQEMAIRPDLQFWKVDANISGANPVLSLVSVSDYEAIGNGSLTLTNNSGQGNIAAQIPCSSTNPPTGTTCAAGSETIGVAFTPTGTFPQEVLACASFAHYVDNSAASNVEAIFQITETAINAQTVIQAGKSRVASASYVANSVDSKPLRVCGNFTFTSGGQKALRLMFEQIVGSTPDANQINADAAASLGARDIHWEVYPINQGIPAPILVGSVNSNSSGAERIERARLTFSGSSAPVIASQSGTWLTGCTRAGTGDYDCAVAAGIFSATPSCNIIGNNTAPNMFRMSGGTANLDILSSNGASAQDITETGMLICMGPR